MIFIFYMGGYSRSSYRFTVINHEVHCSEYYGMPTENAKVISIEGNPDWEKLMGFLSNCNWKRRYDSGVLDGTQWELKVRCDGFRNNSYGSNAYPDNFEEFLALLNKLIDKSGIHLEQ